ncbi:DoxX family protein [Spirosoma sp. KNUC1025]|uniref:DoxX family protein n=1 Tax=Spirosoma sp. KNUC1025 TaxID=2894082 RepID=UPI0038651246|nr:DoxX family protein [Spirosoma sp. KNUC1025]
MKTKTINRLSWLLAGLLAIAFMGAGMSKLAGVQMHIDHFRQWGYPDAMRYVVGILEMGLAIGLLWPKFRLIAVYELFFWATGAVLTHVQAGQSNQVGAPMLFAALGLILLWIERKRFRQNKLSVSR